MVPVTPSKRAARSFADDSLALATGRLLEHYQSGAQTRRVAELLAAQPQARLLIHPGTAAARGISDGDYATVTNERGEVLCRAELSTSVRPDTVFLPFHFPGQENANRLTESATDPISGMPEFKTSRVWVRRAVSSRTLDGVPAGAGIPLHIKEAS
jgi:assimilatory nitrate reductase catalytic subunit